MGVKQMAGYVLLMTTLCLSPTSRALAQDDDRLYAGALVGVSTLSADGRASAQSDRADVSLYKPENGLAINLFVGMPLGRYFTVQANYIWNRNELTLFSSQTSSSGGGFYEQVRHSSQHAIVGDALLYFQPVGSGVRPYLSTGIGLVRFESGHMRLLESGLSGPRSEFESTHLALRVAVGIDLATGKTWSFRYSFSEAISGNPISTHLMPPGERGLANFQNLFGMIRTF
jgi:hypothetical protein